MSDFNNIGGSQEVKAEMCGKDPDADSDDGPPIVISKDESPEKPASVMSSKNSLMVISKDKSSEKPASVMLSEDSVMVISKDEPPEKPASVMSSEDSVMVISKDEPPEKPANVMSSKDSVMIIYKDESSEKPASVMSSKDFLMMISKDESPEKPASVMSSKDSPIDESFEGLHVEKCSKTFIPSTKQEKLPGDFTASSKLTVTYTLKSSDAFNEEAKKEGSSEKQDKTPVCHATPDKDNSEKKWSCVRCGCQKKIPKDVTKSTDDKCVNSCEKRTIRLNRRGSYIHKDVMEESKPSPEKKVSAASTQGNPEKKIIYLSSVKNTTFGVPMDKKITLKRDLPSSLGEGERKKIQYGPEKKDSAVSTKEKEHQEKRIIYLSSVKNSSFGVPKEKKITLKRDLPSSLEEEEKPMKKKIIYLSSTNKPSSDAPKEKKIKLIRTSSSSLEKEEKSSKTVDVPAKKKHPPIKWP